MFFYPEKPIALIYNSEEQFNPLTHELHKQGLAFEVIKPSTQYWDPAQTEVPYSLIINDMSLPPYLNVNAAETKNTIAYLRYLEQITSGSSIINGASIAETFTQRTRQLNIFRSLGLSFPKTTIVGSLEQFLKISHQIKFPVLISTNNAPADSLLFKSEEHLIATLIQDDLKLESQPLIIQEYRPAKGNHIVRAEVINGRFEYAVKIFHPGELNAGLLETKLEHFEPTAQLTIAFEKIARASLMDFGSIECFTDRKSNTLQFHRIQPHTSAYTLPVQDLAITATEKIAEYIFLRARKAREIELAI